MISYKTPGVYIQEIDTFPPGVAAVETAIPAFLGYVERAEKGGLSLIDGVDNDTIITPVRIKSLLEFEQFFGGAPDTQTIRVDISGDAEQKVEKIEVDPSFYLYNSMKLFYDNGGGDCFIVPLGLYKKSDETENSATIDHFTAGLEAIRKVDEPTLLVAPDGVLLDSSARITLYQQMLRQSAELQDRFAILDVAHDYNQKRFELSEAEQFRNAVGASNLQYGAAYYPYLKVTYPLVFRYGNIDLFQGGDNTESEFADLSPNPVHKEAQNIFDDLDSTSALNKLISEGSGFASPFDTAPFNVSLAEGYGMIERSNDKSELEQRAKYIKEMLRTFIALNDNKFNDNSSTASETLISPKSKSTQALHDEKIKANGDLSDAIKRLLIYDRFPNNSLNVFNNTDNIEPEADFYSNIEAEAVENPENNAVQSAVYGDSADSSITEGERVTRARPYFLGLYNDVLGQILDFREQLERRAESLEQFLIDSDPLYQRVHKAIKDHGIILPPSGAVAGVYAYVDSTKGVWKAPANESIASVIGPTLLIDQEDQRELNVDVNAGKSINAIRTFRGKGTLIWGGRTLKGNDDNWRYVNVRRLFIFLEESIEKAMENFVFEPNTANTWVKAQTTIENFLTTVWRQGGLAGEKSEDAFRVSVGLGKTMTADDVNKGLMIIDVMVAPSRPAEFIVLRFSQMQQVS